MSTERFYTESCPRRFFSVLPLHPTSHWHLRLRFQGRRLLNTALYRIHQLYLCSCESHFYTLANQINSPQRHLVTNHQDSKSRWFWVWFPKNIEETLRPGQGPVPGSAVPWASLGAPLRDSPSQVWTTWMKIWWKPAINIYIYICYPPPPCTPVFLQMQWLDDCIETLKSKAAILK